MVKKATIWAGVVLSLLIPVPSSSQGRLSEDQQRQIESHSRQAQEFPKANQPKLAAREYTAILSLDPSNVDARANLGVVFYFQGDFGKAAPQLREALKRQPSLWKVQALLGMCEKRMGQYASARADLENSFPQLKEEKLRIQAGMELVEIYYQAGDREKAAGTIAILRQLKPEDVNIQYTAHRIFSDLADESMLAVAMMAPQSARMQQMMAEKLARRGNVTAAILHYREAVRIDPRLPGIHFELGEELRDSLSPADKEEAEQEYRAALAADPFDAKSECRLGDIALARSDLQGALAHYSRALKFQPDDSDANLGAGRALMAMGQLDKAEPRLLEASRLEPSNATTHYRLAALYRELGRTADADRQLSEFRRLKELREHLRNTYEEIRLRPKDEEQPDEGAPN